MNLEPPHGGEAPAPETRAFAFLQWILAEHRRWRDLGELLASLSERLVAADLPLWRTTLHVPSLHPRLFSVGFVWHQGQAQAVEQPREYGIQRTDAYLRSPVRVVYEEGRSLRLRCDGEKSSAHNQYPLIAELAKQGATEYAIFPLPRLSGSPAAFSMSTRSPGGFSEAEIAFIERILAAVAAVVDIRSSMSIAQTLMDTYVGAGVRARVLRGQVRRGAFETIEAVVWYADLRDFTAISESAGPEELITLLNGWADRMVPPVEAHGGEVIKFMGDGMLAIFPIEPGEEKTSGSRQAVCGAALLAAKDALANMSRWNSERAAGGQGPLKFGLALHVGSVTYGNVGAPHRLDFTAIGSTVNLVARLEKLSRDLGQSLLVSEEFAADCGCPMKPLGRFELRGVARPVTVYGLKERRLRD